MMANNQSVALDWTRADLQECLHVATEALEDFAEDHEHNEVLNQCIDALGRTQGTLVMLELHGLALLAEHLKKMAQWLLETTPEDWEPPAQLLMQGVLELPGYLAELRFGLEDSLELVYPLVNQIRRHLGEAPLGDAGDDPTAVPAQRSDLEAFQALGGAAAAKKVQAAYQQTLLAAFKGADLQKVCKSFTKVGLACQKLCGNSAHALQWRALVWVAQGLESSGAKVDKDRLNLLRRLDSELRAYTSEGVKALMRLPDRSLLVDLLDTAAELGVTEPELGSLVDRMNAQPAQNTSGVDGLAISGRQAFAAATAVVLEETASIKDQLDLFVRSEERNADALDSLLVPARQIVHTLHMLGCSDVGTELDTNVEQLAALVASGTDPDDQILFQVASALVEVEQKIGQSSEGRELTEAQRIEAEAHRAVAESGCGVLEVVKQSFCDYLASNRDARLLSEVPAQIEQTTAVLELTGYDRAAELLTRCGDYLEGLIANNHQPTDDDVREFADALAGIDYYLERLAGEVSTRSDDVLDVVVERLDSLTGSAADAPADENEESVAEADAAVTLETADDEDIPVLNLDSAVSEAVSVDEGTQEERAEDDAAEESTADEQSLVDDVVEAEAENSDDTQDDVLEPELPADAEAAFVAAADADLVSLDALDALDEEDEAPEEVSLHASESDVEETPTIEDATDVHEPDSPSNPAEEMLRSSGDSATVVPEMDDEIIEIFSEEVDETLLRVDECLVEWRDDLTNADALTELRRGYHTLKGSGRIVGATLLGELSWSVENMLNQILDETVEATPQFVDVVLQSRTLLAHLRDCFVSGAAPDTEQVEECAHSADLLASGLALETEAEPVSEDAGDESDATEPVVEETVESLFISEAESLCDEMLQTFEQGEFASEGYPVRGLHTIAGSAENIAGAESIVALARPLYELGLACRNVAGRTAVKAQAVEALKRGVKVVKDQVESLRDGNDVADATRFVQVVNALTSKLAKPSAGAVLEHQSFATLLGSPDYISAWRASELTERDCQVFIESVNELANEPALADWPQVVELLEGLGAVHRTYGTDAVVDDAYTTVGEAYEALARYVDALAVEDTPEDLSAHIDALSELAATDARVVEAVVEAVVEDAVEPVDEDVPEATPLEAEAPTAGADDDDAFIDAAELLTAVEAADDQVAVGEPLDDADPVAELDDAFFSEAEELLEIPDAGDAETETSAETPAIEESSIEAIDDEVPMLGDALPGSTAQPVPQSLMLSPETTGAASQQSASGAVENLEEIDSDLVQVFFEEAEELLEALDEGSHKWMAERDNHLHLENLLRGLHTLKGGARLTGLMNLGELAHGFESFLIDVQDAGGPFDDAMFASLLERYDRLEAHIGAVKTALHGHDGPVDTVSPQSMAEDADHRKSQNAAVATPEPNENSAPQEMIRVGAALLDQLVNLAGESSILRARIEQGMSDFSTALDEMEDTIDRTREQLRRLEIETEAQILFRQERPEGPSYEEFDPLEMDRYSKLQQLSRSLSESASDMLDLKETLMFKARESETLLIQQARINTELQEGLMRTRMVPFNRLLPRLRRIVRQIAAEVGKDVEFVAFDTEGELDRNLLERMIPPLEHMLRNAVDHGIEARDARLQSGKKPTGKVALRLTREGGDVVIEIADDGAGIDVDRVRTKAIERGLCSPDAQLEDDEVFQFVLSPGFSTAQSVTQISGRGVGMDVVNSEVKQLGGTLNIRSRVGQGTRFVVRVPFTVSVNRALMVVVGDDTYAVPLNTIEGIVLLNVRELEKYYGSGDAPFQYAGMSYRVDYLGRYLGREFRQDPNRQSIPMVLVRSGDQAIAVLVDGVQGSREIVVKSLGPQFAGVQGISGATIMGDGSVVVILDLVALIRSDAAQDAHAISDLQQDLNHPRCVMVVDDSVTVRKVTSRLLERQGMDVLIAKDGIEAISLLQEREPDIMLLDIEMPRMDGFEVARQVRHDERLRELPIVMISSRTGEKHKEHARELGVNEFLGKPFQENELLSTIETLVK